MDNEDADAAVARLVAAGLGSALNQPRLDHDALRLRSESGAGIDDILRFV